MAITKGKRTRRKTVRRASGEVHASTTKVRNQRAVKGKVYRLKLGPSSRSHSAHISKAGRAGAAGSGRRSSGSWDTQKWLIGKKLAHVVKEKLIADFRKESSPASEQKTKRRRRRG